MYYYGDYIGFNVFFYSYKGVIILVYENVCVCLVNDEKIKLEVLLIIIYEDGIKIYFNGEIFYVMYLVVGYIDGDSVVWFE